jgi:probable selenium-dependent hydroxylase accessory protein YqeC
VVAFVGAGGKSSAILHVAHELKEAGVKVLAAPTTKMLVEEAEGVGPLVTSKSEDRLPEKTAEKLAEAGAASSRASSLP